MIPEKHLKEKPNGELLNLLHNWAIYVSLWEGFDEAQVIQRVRKTLPGLSIPAGAGSAPGSESTEAAPVEDSGSDSEAQTVAPFPSSTPAAGPGAGGTSATRQGVKRTREAADSSSIKSTPKKPKPSGSAPGSVELLRSPPPSASAVTTVGDLSWLEGQMAVLITATQDCARALRDTAAQLNLIHRVLKAALVDEKIGEAARKLAAKLKRSKELDEEEGEGDSGAEDSDAEEQKAPVASAARAKSKSKAKSAKKEGKSREDQAMELNSKIMGR